MFALRSAGSILRQRAAPPLVATVQVNAHANAHTNTPIVLGVAGLAGMAALPATRSRAPVRWARRAFVRLNSGVAGAGRVGLRAAGAVGRLGKRTLPGRMAGQAIGRLYPGRAARAVTRLRISGRTMIRFNSTQAGRRLPPSASAKDSKDTASTTSGSASTSTSGGNGSGSSGGSGSGGSGNGKGKKTLKDKLSRAWKTPTKWYPIPIALGALVLVAVQWRKQKREEPLVETQGPDGAVVRAEGPWQVRILGALPLRSMSRLWGYLNSLVLPVWFRPYGFRFYGWIFGCNLDECVPQDLTQYESLGEFFYRELKAGARPIADAEVVSPADGRVLHLGEIAGSKVEQVKGMTYSLNALLGQGAEPFSQMEIERQGSSKIVGGQNVRSYDDENFAEINEIPYSLGSLMGTDSAAEVQENPSDVNEGEADASVQAQTDVQHDASVASKLGLKAVIPETGKDAELAPIKPGNKLFFCVIYLAPGDYHRYHSPTAWVVERRRHFTGDLFSVSPYIANRLRNLFVLNERVALLGRWKHGFFSMTPVGATNVGSIIVNFDKTLRTNTSERTHPPQTFTEAVYSSASILKGQPLLPGEEMGGFKLGSTIVLVFEAPKEFKFQVKPGDYVKVGQELGEIDA